MIYISLPHMYENFDFNNFLKHKALDQKSTYNTFFNIDFEIETTYGNFPFTYWNGDLNNNYNRGKFPLYPDIELFFAETDIPARIDCSNILLDERDLNDIHQNVILNLGNNSGNYIEVSSLAILNYIKDKYNYDFILSKYSDLIYPLNANIINTFIDQNIFYLISLPDYLKIDIEQLNSIKNKNKIEITVGNKCLCAPEQVRKCIEQEQKNQIEFSGCTVYNECPHLINYYNTISLVEEIQHFRNLGFSHFRIDSPPYAKIQDFQYFIMQNLILPKYYPEMFNRMLKGDFK